MDYSCKRVEWPDLDAFRGLMAVFAAVFEEPETYLGSPPSADYVRALLEHETFIALAAIEDDEVIGGLVAYELRKFEQERSEIYIYDLGVRERHRRKGVATALIEELRAIARSRQAWVIFVQADRGDTAAINLYESLGAPESVYQFDIPV
jgi:aminoglycoside 3-N-acetyltransferase I